MNITRPLGIVASMLLLSNGAQSQESISSAIERAGPAFASAGTGRTVAVLDFPGLSNNVTELSAFVSEELSTALAIALQGKGKVVERRQVLQVLAEEQLAVAGLTGPQIGRVAAKLRADVVVIGTMTVLGSQIIINARLVEAATGSMLMAQRISGTGSQEIMALAERGLGPPAGTQGRVGQSGVGAAPTATRNRASERASAPMPAQYENDFIRVRVDAASVSRDGRRAVVTFTVENKGSGEEFFARHGQRANLADSNAGGWYLDENSTSGFAANSSCGRACWNADSYTRLAPGGRQTVVLAFRSETHGNSATPSSVSFSMECERRRGDSRMELFTIGVANIPISAR